MAIKYLKKAIKTPSTDDHKTRSAVQSILNDIEKTKEEGIKKITKKFDKYGKWMDGWETRRKRAKGHDYLILKLGKPGKIYKVDIDTSYFNGNQPSKVSLDACFSKKKLPTKNSKWVNILKKKSTKPNSHHFFNIKNKSIFTHINRSENQQQI